MCELLADRAGIERGFAFTAGLLSALDRLLGVPLAEVADKVDVDQELAAAAFRKEGMVGKLVRLVTEYQDAVDAGGPTRSELGERRAHRRHGVRLGHVARQRHRADPDAALSPADSARFPAPRPTRGRRTVPS